MVRSHPADIARRLHRTPGRRAARARARIARWLGGHAAIDRLPHRLAWRLHRLVGAEPPPAIAAWGRATGGRRVLIVSNDLSRSGAPQLAVEVARLLIERGDLVTLLSPVDGPLRAELVAHGATVIVDLAIRMPDAPILPLLAAGVDIALCNTVDTAAAALPLARAVPTVLYLHEVTLLAERLESMPPVAAALRAVTQLWAGSELSAAVARPVRADVAVVPYGLDPVRDPGGAVPPVAAAPRLALSVFASFEHRKGQDALAEAIGLLDSATRGQLTLRLYGRTLFPDFQAALVARAATLPEVRLCEPLDTAGYRAALLASDAVVVPSRSDTLPLVSLDALGAGRVLICTRTTGTSAYLTPGRDGFVAETAEPAALAATLREAVARRADWPAVAAAGRQLFDRHFSRPAFAQTIEGRLAALSGAGAP